MVTLDELVAQDPQGKQTVLASWAGGPGPEGKYRLDLRLPLKKRRNIFPAVL